jgi:EcsC protein family
MKSAIIAAARPSMSGYEVRAYKRLTSPPQNSPSLVPQKVRGTASRVGRSVKERASTMPGNEVVAEGYAKAAQGLMDFTMGNGIHSVTLEGSMKRHQKMGRDVRAHADFLQLDLRQCDEVLPNRKRLHEVVAIAEGAASSLLITGATVSTTVSGGATAAVVITTVAADSVAVMAGLGRVVGEVAVSYGFDPNLPEEELFALQVVGLGMAVGSGEKAIALASLARLTQDMMRRATWTQLNEHLLVQVINRAFAGLGLRLTQKKLAQVVPIAGVFISSGLNLHLVRRVHAAAVDAYRLRFLTEKYGLESSASTDVIPLRGEVSDEEEVLQIPEMIGKALRNAEAVGDRTEPAAKLGYSSEEIRA